MPNQNKVDKVDYEFEKDSAEEDDEENDSFPVDTDELSEVGAAVLLFISAIGVLILRILQIFVVFISWLWFLYSVSPILFFGFGLAIVNVPYVIYQDTIIQEIDFFMRCRVFPFYQTWPRQLIVIIQMIWNPLICYYNATEWLAYGVIQQVVVPLFIDCGLADTALAFLRFFVVFVVDFFVDYVASLAFLTGDFNYIPSGVAWNTAWTTWQNTLTCTCEDLAPFARAAWIITVFPPVSPLPAQIFIGFPMQVIAHVPNIANVFYGPILGFIAGNQVGDTNSWCALWSAFNGVMNVAQEIIRVLAALLTGQLNASFPRPDFGRATNNFCQAVSCFVRSVENVNQYLFDEFIPIPFLNWHEFLCIYDSFICLILRAVDNILRILINIDRVVNYPSDPFYEQVIVPDVIYWLNLVAPPRYQSPTTVLPMYPVNYTSWLWPTDAPLIPGTVKTNPIYQQKRFSDCICIYISRIICNPADPTTPCFNENVQTILGPFDPCCVVVEALSTVADSVAFPFDLTRHLYDFTVTTTFLNNQYFTTAIARDLTAVVGCVFDAFSIIPTVGPCIDLFFTEVVRYIFSLVDFLLRVITGLIFLPYYIINALPNFIQNRGQALQFFLNITDQLTNATLPDSAINCACFALNSIGIPPVPCTSCVRGGFIQPTITKRFPTTAKIMERHRVLDLQKSGGFQEDSEKPRWEYRDTVRILQNLTDDSPYDEPTYEDLQRYLGAKRENLNTRIRRILDKHRRSERNFAGTYTLSPTQPPVALTCTDPVPECFDLCCNLRSSADLLYKVSRFLGTTINSLAQDWDIGFPFFVTGDVSICSALCPTQQTDASDCSVPCPGVNYTFEQSLSDVIIAATQVLVCFCNGFNEVIPVTGFPSIYTERPDVCCWVVRLGDLIAASLLVFVRSIKELAQGNVSPPGTPPFPYFTQGQFIMDVDQLFDIQLDVVVCVGFLVRSVFPVQTVADLDVYCIVENLATFLIQLTNWITNIIISLGTIQFTVGQNFFIDPNCNWEATGCVPQVTNLPFFTEGVVVINSFFGTQGGACADNVVAGACVTAHGTDLGIGGVTQCICQVVSTIFPIRPNPGAPTGPPDNCPIVDVCCPLRQLSFALGTSQVFMLQGLTTLWQRWDGAYPSAFFAWWFCNEEASPIPEGCGIINPSINAITDVISLCVCQVFQLLDAFLANFFPGFRCFCGGGFPEGIFCSVGNLVYTILVQLITLLRRANDITYWQPEGYPAPDQSLTWAVRFFGPIQDELCDFVGANVCFVTTLVPFCPNWLSRLFQSQFIWLYEIVIRIAQFLEGFISTFAGAPCASAIQSSVYGINTSCLNGALTSIFSFWFDALLADGMLACRDDPCSCHDGIYVNPLGEQKNYTFSNAISGGVLGQDGRIPQPCVQGNNFFDAPWWFETCCNGTAATYVYPTGVVKQCPAYNTTGDPIPECLPQCFPTTPQPCKFTSPALPMCNSVIGYLPMDGVFMATLRVFRCLFELAFGGGPLFDGVIQLTSVIWQLTKPIINVVTSTIVFIFNLFINPGGPLDFLGKVVGYFSSLSALFNAPIIVPPAGDPFITRQRRRIGFKQYGGIVQGLRAVFQDYTVADCPVDLTSCVNRNFGANCTTTACTTAYLKTQFTRESTCDVLVNSVEPVTPTGNPTGDPFHYSFSVGNELTSRLMYINCIEKRIMGNRVRDMLYPNFPPEVMYHGWSSIPAFLEEINESFHKLQMFGQYPGQDFTKTDYAFANMEQELRERAEKIELSRRFSPETTRIVVKFDAIEHKIRSGYYTHLIRRIARSRRENRDTMVHLSSQHSFSNLAAVYKGAAYDIVDISVHNVPRVIQALGKSASATIDFVSDTVALRKRWDSFAEKWWEHMKKETPEDHERRERIRSIVRNAPLYKWFARTTEQTWQGPQWPAANFIRHLANLSRIARNSTEPGYWNLFGIRTRIDATKEHLYNRFFKAYWTGKQRANYANGKSTALRIYDTLYPGHITREDYERFILDEGCPIINDSVNLVISAYSYCANRQQTNRDRMPRKDNHKLYTTMFGHRMADKMETLFNYANATSEFILENDRIRRERAYVPSRLRKDRFVRAMGFRHNVSESWFDFDYRQGAIDMYPRHMKMQVWGPLRGNLNEFNGFLGPVNVEAANPLPLHKNISVVGYKAYRRATMTKRQNEGVPMWNLYNYLISIVEWITGWGINEWLAQTFINFQELALNPNFKCTDWPNVGIYYYVYKIFNCDFPCDHDGRNGIGLEAALGWVLGIYGIALLVCVFIFRSLFATVVSSLVLGVVFLIVLPWVAYGFSVRCLYLTPSVFVGGFSVSWWPFLFVSTFPFNIVDDILALADKWISSCYAFLWARYMLRSPTACPACPARMDIANCLYQVGIGDGLSNALWLGYQIGGSGFCGIISGFASFFDTIIPGTAEYVQLTCANLASTNPDVQSSMMWCFWSTILSLVAPLTLFAIGATFLAFIIPSLWDVIIALWYVIYYSPLAIIWSAGSAFMSQPSDTLEGDAENFEEDKENFPAFAAGINMATRFIKTAVRKGEVKKYKKD